jgi:hypothetical protein
LTVTSNSLWGLLLFGLPTQDFERKKSQLSENKTVDLCCIFFVTALGCRVMIDMQLIIYNLDSDSLTGLAGK